MPWAAPAATSRRQVDGLQDLRVEQAHGRVDAGDCRRSPVSAAGGRPARLVTHGPP